MHICSSRLLCKLHSKRVDLACERYRRGFDGLPRKLVMLAPYLYPDLPFKDYCPVFDVLRSIILSGWNREVIGDHFRHSNPFWGNGEEQKQFIDAVQMITRNQGNKYPYKGLQVIFQGSEASVDVMFHTYGLKNIEGRPDMPDHYTLVEVQRAHIPYSVFLVLHGGCVYEPKEVGATTEWFRLHWDSKPWTF